MKKERQGKSGVSVILCLAVVLILSNSAWAAEKPEVFVQLGHSNFVETMAFSPDGRFVLSGDSDNILKLWDIYTGKEIRTFVGHKGSVKSIAFSSNGNYAISGGKDNTIILWDILNGEKIKSFIGHTNYITSVLFSPDGKYIYSGSEDNTFKLWDISTGKEVLTKALPFSIENINFLPNRKNMLIGSHLGSYLDTGRPSGIIIFDSSSGEIIKQFPDPEIVISLSLSRDGKYIVYGTNHAIKIMNIEKLEIIKTLNAEEYEDGCEAIFTKDGRDVIFHCDGKNNTIRVWNINKNKIVKEFEDSKWSKGIILNPNGDKVIARNYHNFILYEVSSGKKLKNFKGYSDEVEFISFTNDKEYGLTQIGDNSLILWSLSNYSIKKTIQGSGFRSLCQVFSEDGKYLVVKNDKTSLKVLDLSSDKQPTHINAYKKELQTASISNDGKYIMTNGTDTFPFITKVWDTQTGNEALSLEHGDTSGSSSMGYISSINNGDNCNYFLFDGITGFPIWLADLKMKEVKKFSWWDKESIRINGAGSEDVKHAVISPNCQYILSGGYDKSILMWDIITGKIIKKLEDKTGHISCLDISKDGKFALSANSEYNITLWDILSGNSLNTIKGHTAKINSVSFMPDNRYGISASDDKTVRLWNLSSGKEIVKVVHFTDGEWLAITPEGYYNASVNGDKYLNVRIGNNVYGIDQYKAKYYRPDIVQLALKLGDTQQAIAQLKGDTEGLKASEQPPKVWFVSPSDRYETDKPFIEVRVKTEDIADTAESVTFKVNQRILATEKKPVRPVSEGAKVREFSRQVPLIPGENFIEAEAKGKAGATQKTIIMVIRKGAEKKLPALWYFGAGVSQHSISSLSLKYSAKDVTGLADALKNQKGRAYSEVNIRTLTDAEATRGNIMDSIESFFAGAKQEDVAILFVSGHGMNSASGYSFIAHDTNPDKLSSTGVSWEFFNNVLKTVKSNVLLFADTCHSGNISGNENWKNQANADTNEFLRGAADNGVIVFASSSGASVSREDPSWGHGAFAKALIDGIMGGAAFMENKVDIASLQTYVKSTVQKLTENTQQPVIPKLTGGGAFLDLVLAKKG